MIQVGVYANCNNKCAFCTVKDTVPFTEDQIIQEIHNCRENIKYQDWEDKFSDGISIIGGEIYCDWGQRIKDEFLLLVDDIIEKILTVSKNPNCRFSTVTNGMYDPEWLLFPVVDKIAAATPLGVQSCDINFSYDLKYRFATEDRRKLCESTINRFHEKYNYRTGVQMILTQYLIDEILYNGWRPSKFIDEVLPGNFLALLYPHPIHRGRDNNNGIRIKDFNFRRADLFKVLPIIQEDAPLTYRGFIESTRNSQSFKYTGNFFKSGTGPVDQPAILSDGKEFKNPSCSHSILYQCYSDSTACLLCDLENYDG